MPSVDSFARRWAGAELMDDPSCDERLLFRTFDQLALINRLIARCRSILTRYVLRDMERNSARAYRLIDLGAGGCDIARWLLAAAARRGLRLVVLALDSDPRAIAYARSRGTPEGLCLERADLMDMARFGPADYVFCNHVLHHLSDEALPRAIGLMDRTATRLWLAADLRRSRLSYAAFHLLAPLLRDSFAFEDGKRSIRRGFRADELRAAALAARPRAAIRVECLTPGRLLLVGAQREYALDAFDC
jgi:2-polyprenyl-3-methyl-5-hydroxy-6-metoxy-1,4-benzoquinol methylase